MAAVVVALRASVCENCVRKSSVHCAIYVLHARRISQLCINIGNCTQTHTQKWRLYCDKIQSTMTTQRTTATSTNTQANTSRLKKKSGNKNRNARASPLKNKGRNRIRFTRIPHLVSDAGITLQHFHFIPNAFSFVAFQDPLFSFRNSNIYIFFFYLRRRRREFSFSYMLLFSLNRLVRTAAVMLWT